MSDKMNIEFFDASLVCKRLEMRKTKLVQYMQVQIENEHWSKVAETAGELRELEAELQVWSKFRRGTDLLV